MDKIRCIANYFVTKCNDNNIIITHLKLQKLVYYAQALCLVLYGKPLFNNRIEAWVHGPVCPDLYMDYKNIFTRNMPISDHNAFDWHKYLTEQEIAVLEKIFLTYGQMSGAQLEEFTHCDEPWIQARMGLKPWEKSDREITAISIRSYYAKKYRH